jgi:hypothetical protein
MKTSIFQGARGRAPLGLALAASVALAACSDSPTGTDLGPQEAVNFQRLLVTDAQQPTGRLIALHNDSLVQQFSFAGPATRVNTTSSGRFAAAIQGPEGRVNFIDGGVWTENTTGHRRDAALLGFQLSDGRPSYENVVGDWLSVYFDASGRARWLRESEMAAGSPRVAHEINTGAPHHGAAIVVMANNVPFFAHSVANAAGAPQGMTVRNQQGQVVSEVPVGQCPGLHGNASLATGGVVGCNDGMVLVRPSGNTVQAQKITLSGDMAGLALRNAYTGHGGSFILGQFAAFPGQPAQRVLAVINPTTGAVDRLPALPAGVTDHWRAIEPVKGQIVLLGTNGSLYVYGSNRQLQHTVAGVVPALPTSGAMAHTIAVAEDLAAVASPSTGEVVLVNLATGAQIRRINVGGAPSRLALLGAQRAGAFTAAR